MKNFILRHLIDDSHRKAARLFCPDTVMTTPDTDLTLIGMFINGPELHGAGWILLHTDVKEGSILVGHVLRGNDDFSDKDTLALRRALMTEVHNIARASKFTSCTVRCFDMEEVELYHDLGYVEDSLSASFPAVLTYDFQYGLEMLEIDDKQTVTVVLQHASTKRVLAVQHLDGRTVKFMVNSYETPLDGQVCAITSIEVDAKSGALLAWILPEEESAPLPSTFDNTSGGGPRTLGPGTIPISTPAK